MHLFAGSRISSKYYCAFVFLSRGLHRRVAYLRNLNLFDFFNFLTTTWTISNFIKQHKSALLKIVLQRNSNLEALIVHRSSIEVSYFLEWTYVCVRNSQHNYYVFAFWCSFIICICSWSGQWKSVYNWCSSLMEIMTRMVMVMVVMPI